MTDHADLDRLGILPAGNGKPAAKPRRRKPAAKPKGTVMDDSLLHPDGQTELANSRRFLDLHRDKVRYCHPWRKWLVWDGCRWKTDDDGAALRLAKDVPDSIWRLGQTFDQQSLLRFAAASSKANHLRDVLALAACEVPIQPADMDANPFLLNCPNGTVDMRTGEIREHRREDNLTKCCPVEYRPDAEAFHWDVFLQGVFEPTPDVIPFLQRFLGYAATGDVREQILAVFHGTGANGKTTLIEAVTETLGPDYSGAAPKDLLMVKRGDAHPTEWADLFGKRLVVSQETEQSRTLAESAVKQLTGADEIPCRRMREDWWRFRPQHQLILVTNHRPRVKGTDHAIWRRLRLIPFAVKFEGAAKDKRMPERLRDERKAILAWIVRGAVDWFSDGLAEPDTVMHATNEYRDSEDVIRQFIDERCVVCEGIETKAGELYKAYRTWADDAGEKYPMSNKAFGEALAEKGFDRRKSHGIILRRGIGLA